MENILVNNKDITDLVTSFEQYDEINTDENSIIGNAASTQIKLTLKNKDNQLDDLLDYPFMIGNKTYIVYEKPEKWTKSIAVTLYDRMILSNIAYATKLEYPVTISDQLDEISEMMDTEVDKSTLSEDLLMKKVSWYDSTIIIRNYLEFIAQCDGKNAFIENDKIVFRALAEKTHITDFCSDYELNEMNVFTRVCYDNGITAPLSKGEEKGKTLYLSSNNSYADQSDIDRIFEMYNGLSFYSLRKFKCRAIDEIRLTDLVIYNDITFLPLSIKRKVYGGKARDSLEMTADIVIKNAETVIVRENMLSRIRRMQTIIDQNNVKLTILGQNADYQTELLKNSISTSLVLNYVSSQTYDEPHNSYYPDYTLQPLKITAITRDTLKNTIANGNYVWKRKGQNDEEYVDLIEGETCLENILTVSHNLSDSVEYKAYVEVTTDKGAVLNDEASISINLNTLNEAEVNGEMCSIEASGVSFVEQEGNYNYTSIILMPHFMQCSFDLWLYSVDLGGEYLAITPVAQETDADEIETDVYSTNVRGIDFNADDNSLIISSEAECFEMTNVVVFQLKADVASATDTVSITRESDLATQVSDIINDLNQLTQNYTDVLMEIDGLNGTITNRVEQMEQNYTDNAEIISQQLSEIIQKADFIEERFISLKETVDTNGSDLETITTYIRKTAKGIEVGELEANVKTLMATDHFSIIFNDEEVMTLEQTLMTIERIRVLANFQMGNSIFTANDYGFDITWGGDQ